MEYTLDQYQRKGGKIVTTSDGFKYIYHKSQNNIHYLKCALFRNGCKGSAKLDTEIAKLITTSSLFELMPTSN